MQTRQKEKLLNSNRRYSLRKLSVGLASVLIGISFLNGTKTTVKADTIANNNDKYAEAHENNESDESMQAALLKNTDVAEGDSVHTQSDKNVDTAGILTGTSSVQSSSAAQNSSEITKSFGLGADKSKKSVQSSNTLLNVKNSNISTKMGEVSKAGNFEAAGDISSAQNSVAKPQHNNLLDDLDKQKTFTENNQAEAKNQENRLADQTNYKLTNNGGIDSREDLGQNLTVPDETKSTLTTKSDAEKSITQTSSDQHVNNQLNNRVEGNSQAQPQNSLKLAKRMLTTNLIATPPMTNGGFDEATWGKLDITKWRGSVQDGVYQLTWYTGDSRHIIVPNEADFEQAGKSTNGLQVGITRDTIYSLSSRGQTIAFSKTNNQKVKAIGTDWSSAFSYHTNLSKFDGSNLDVSNVTNMSDMFSNTSISDLTSLAHWDTRKVTYMSGMFQDNSISDLTPLTYWDTGNVTDMGGMFRGNSISDLTPLAKWDTRKVTNMSGMLSYNSISDLTPLTHWDTGKVTYMSYMFYNNSISNLTPLANWNVSKVTDMSEMFHSNSISNLTPLAYWDTSEVTHMNWMFNDNSIRDLTPLTHWNTNKVTDMSGIFSANPDIIDLKPIADWNISGVGLFSYDPQLNLIDINNTQLIQDFLKDPNALASAIFITNNADLVKATINKDIPTLTNAAKRTITFNIPNDAPKTIVQIINYKAISPVQVDFDAQKIVKTYPVKDSDWRLDDSNSNVTVNGQSSTEYKAYTLDPNGKDIDFAAIPLPKIPGYKVKISRIPSGNLAQPAMFLVSFVALPERLQNNQLNNVQLPQKPAQPEQKPANDKQVDQGIDYISHTLMRNSSGSANSFEPAQNGSALLEVFSDSTQNGDDAKTQKVNTAKHKKYIVKKRAVKRRRKNAKKYHLKRRSRKHTKRSRHAKKRMIKHRKRVSRKFRRFHLKHIKKA